MSDADYLRKLAERRDAQGRRHDADFLRLMAIYFDLLRRTDSGTPSKDKA